MSQAPSADLTLLLQRAGFVLTPVQIAEYTEAYGYITEMAGRIRSPRSYMAEPAHVFTFPAEGAAVAASSEAAS